MRHFQSLELYSRLFPIIGTVLLALGDPSARAAVFTVTSAADAGAATLRAAITNANATAGSHSIAFNLSAPYRILLASNLPDLTNSVLVDGTTQPGYAGAPRVALTPAVGSTATKGLNLSGRGTTAQGLFISGFSQNGIELNSVSNQVAGCWLMSNGVGVTVYTASQYAQIGGTAASNRNVISANSGAGIYLSSGDRASVLGNYIGLAPDGLAALGNGQHGVSCSASNATVGGSAAGARNVIGGNTNSGVYGTGGNCRNLLVAGNYIGTDATGTSAVPNAAGVQLVSGTSNTIGGGSASFRNIIAGNSGSGILLSTSSLTGTYHLIEYNYIGLAANGAPLPNNNGISIQSASNTVALNVISGNSGAGVTLISTGARGNILSGNLIGTDAAGTEARPNGGGISVLSGAADNLIVGSLLRNVISGNGNAGIQVGNSTNTTISGNYIGVSISGSAAIPNQSAGLFVTGSAGTTISQNLISGNGGTGLEISGPANRNTAVNGNFIGLDATGLNAIPNAGAGLYALGGSGLEIGTAARNCIAGNSSRGIWLQSALTNVVVAGNYIGVATNGATARPNSGGVFVDANDVSGLTISNNVISGNTGDGLEMNFTAAGRPPTNVVLVGNIVGLNSAATLAVSNEQEGVSLMSMSNVRIGGASAGERNVIAGYGVNGIGLALCGSNGPVVIAGNYIGVSGGGNLLTNWSGGVHGISIQESGGLQVGGPSSAWRNLVGDNDVGIVVDHSDHNWLSYNLVGCDSSATLARPNGDGVILSGGSSTNLLENNIVAGNLGKGFSLLGCATNTVRANRIGYGSIDALPNGGVGVYLSECQDNMIGGYAAPDGNRIAFNGAPGVVVAGSTNSLRNFILANLIYSNAAPGIDLGYDGITFDDPPPDADAGPNGLQNKPRLLFASTGATNVAGQMAGRSGTLRLEFFAQTPANGALFLGATNLYVPPAGSTPFSFALPPAGAPSGSVVVATATSEDGTSELADPVSTGVALDSDGDLMPDWWEIGHSLNPAVSNAPGSDADTDGCGDLAEWIADTDPVDADSCLHIVSVSNAAAFTSFVPSSGLRRYALESADEPDAAWAVVLSDIPGTGSLLAMPDPLGYPRRMYRVGVKLP